MYEFSIKFSKILLDTLILKMKKKIPYFYIKTNDPQYKY